MHQLTIDSFLDRARSEVQEIGAEHGDALCFIIDQARQPDALARLYGLGQPLEPTNLFLGTEFEALAEQGPIWIGGEITPELKALAADLCIERNAGICLVTSDVQQALTHARWLLKANDGSGGQSILSYYRAELWAALASTAGAKLSQLMGPWSAVLSPAPKQVRESSKRWIEWRLDADRPLAAKNTFFNLPPGCFVAQRLFARVYWVDEHFQNFGKPRGDSLHRIVANLTLLSDHQITQGRHLLRLSPLICGSLLQPRTDVQRVLESSGAAYFKVQQLERLPGSTPLLRTLLKRGTMCQRSVHVQTQKIQPRIQARSHRAISPARCQLPPGGLRDWH